MEPGSRSPRASRHPVHEPIQIDLEKETFAIEAVAVGALIGDGFNRPEYEEWST